MAGTALPCDLMMDIHCRKTFCREEGTGDVADLFGGLSDAAQAALRRGEDAYVAKVAFPFRAATADDVAACALPFEKALRPLFDEPLRLRQAAAAAEQAASKHLSQRRHKLATFLRDLDQDWPFWVRP